ncbi:MAG: DNA-binding NtrC family response regulator [Phenylobacterium sp.]|jgi:DNA-binding NtrC family response regulator
MSPSKLACNRPVEKKLLIIEGDPSVAKIHCHMAKRIGLQATVTKSYAQTKQLLDSTQDFFCAVVDYNMPDACNGETIDYVVEAGISVVVMTGTTNINGDGRR